MSDSQSPSPFGRTILCFPLVKFSYATVHSNMTSVPWSHISSADIFVLLEHVNNTADPNLQLRIVEGTNNLVRRLQQTIAPTSLTSPSDINRAPGEHTTY